MLVLTRKVGDGIRIGNNVIIKVIELKGGGVRIGIDAPQDMKIYRQEVYDRITQENQEALQWNMADLDALSANLIVDTKKK